MQYGRTHLINMLLNIPEEGWTRQKIKDLIDSLWRDKPALRWSGFEFAGAPDSAMGFDALTRTFYIEPVDALFSFYQYRNKLTCHTKKTRQEIIIDDTEGLHLIYFDQDPDTKEEVLFVEVNPTANEIESTYVDRCIVAWLYWDATAKTVLYYGDSRHGSEFPSRVHWWIHQTINSHRESGITITGSVPDGDGSNASHTQYGISAGTLWHDDIHDSVDAVTAVAALPIWYFDSSGRPRYTTQTGSKHINAGSGRMAYASGGSFVEATDEYFVTYHVFATNCFYQQHIVAIGQSQYADLPAAIASIDAEVVDLKTALPHSNLMHIASVVYQTSSSFSNPDKGRIVTVIQTINTDMSVTGDGSKINPVRLVGDLLNPGPLKFYGTNDLEIKGYHSLLDYLSGLSDKSIIGDGSVEFPYQLDGDEENPGPNKSYKTDAHGNKGWFPDGTTPGSESGSGSGDTDDNIFKVAIKFEQADEFVYICPFTMKVTEIESGSATLDPVLNTILFKDDELTITASTAGLIILKGEML